MARKAGSMRAGRGGVKRVKEPLIDSEVPCATEGALVDRSRKRWNGRERTEAWPESATSESLQDGVVQRFLSGIVARWVVPRQRRFSRRADAFRLAGLGVVRGRAGANLYGMPAGQSQRSKTA